MALRSFNSIIIFDTCFFTESVLSPNIVAKTILNNNSVTKETLDLLLTNIPGLEQYVVLLDSFLGKIC